MRLLKMVPDDTNIDFVRLRHAAFTITTLLTVAAIALVLVRGLNMGVDFVGGLMIEEKFESPRSEEHTSELQSLMRISYAVFCLKKKKQIHKMKPMTNDNR